MSDNPLSVLYVFQVVTYSSFFSNFLLNYKSSDQPARNHRHNNNNHNTEYADEYVYRLYVVRYRK